MLWWIFYMCHDGFEQKSLWDAPIDEIARFHSYLISLSNFRSLFSWDIPVYTSTHNSYYFLVPHSNQHFLFKCLTFADVIEIRLICLWCNALFGARTLTSHISTIIFLRECWWCGSCGQHLNFMKTEKKVGSRLTLYSSETPVAQHEESMANGVMW